jgi:hypothetical protein
MNPETMPFDHLMHWVPNLDTTIAHCAAAGFRPTNGGQLGNGMHNAFWRGRDLTYIELISVFDWEGWRSSSRPSTTVRSAREAAMAAGGGALQFAFEVEDIAAIGAALRHRGVDVGDPRVGTWQRNTDGATFSWEAAWVIDGPAWRPFFIHYPARRAENLVRRRSEHARLPDWSFHRLDLETTEPMASAEWLGRVLDLRVGSANGMPEIAAPGCTIRFVAGPADRVTRVVLDGTDGPLGDVAGVRYERRVDLPNEPR